METKHTKGEWTVINGWDKDGNGTMFPSVLLYGDEALHKKTCGRNSITINVSHDQKVESLMANAKLIAAAPDLLEACLEAKAYGSVYGMNSGVYDKLLAAIKKATE